MKKIDLARKIADAQDEFGLYMLGPLPSHVHDFEYTAENVAQYLAKNRTMYQLMDIMG